jgi:hypothetical protein
MDTLLAQSLEPKCSEIKEADVFSNPVAFMAPKVSKKLSQILVIAAQMENYS